MANDREPDDTVDMPALAPVEDGDGRVVLVPVVRRTRKEGLGRGLSARV